MELADILVVVIGIIVAVVVIGFFSYLIGHSFRQLNHGDLNYELKEENKGTTWVSLAIGLFH